MTRASFFPHLLRHAPMSLRTRLLLLVIVSVVPLVGLGLVREYGQYQAERDNVYQGLLTVARGVAVAVDRDLLLRTAALETLAMSPALQSDDLTGFDAQARLFLDRQPEGATLGLVGRDHRIIQAYGAQGPAVGIEHTATGGGEDAFQRGQAVVTDLHNGRVTGKPGFSVDVPVFRDGRIAYELFLRLRPSMMQDLLTEQHLPQDRTIAITDTRGAIVARLPNPEQFIGRTMVASLRQLIGSQPEGLTQNRTLEGTPVIVAFTRAGPGWSVTIGAPESLILGPLRDGIIRIATDGLIVLSAGMILAVFAARRITEPIARLARLAEGHNPGVDQTLQTGLAETDSVARALAIAAAERRAAAEALAESEYRFRTLFESSPSGVILVDPDTLQVIDSNETAAGFVGYTRAEFRGVSMFDLRESSSEQRIREIARAVTSGEVVQYEARVNGRHDMRDLSIATGPMRLRGRTVLLISQIDVTDLRRAEVDLRRNEERLQLAREGASLGIWDWDLASDRVTWSDYEFTLHGLAVEPNGTPPANWWDVIDPADLGAVRSEYRRTFRHPGHRFTCEYSVRPSDGSKRRLLTSGQAIRGSDGRVNRLVGISMDVTARFEAERARDWLISLLQTERGRLSEIIEALPVGVGIVNQDGHFTLSNQVMRRSLGQFQSSAEAAASERWVARDLHGDRIAVVEALIGRALRGHETLPGDEFVHEWADRSTTWFRVAALPLRAEDGGMHEALIVLQDIDDERRLVELERQANARLEQRVREEVSAREAAQQRAAQAERVQALGQIAGGVAHDFNNVLQAVTGGAALIERRPDQVERVLRYARMISDAARRGAAITSRLLAFARRGDLRAESVDPALLLQDMAEILSHTLGGSVRCAVDARSDLPPLFADRGQLETVLVNLATNARDAMPNGGILTFSARPEQVTSHGTHGTRPAGLAAGAYIRISVADTGVGMGAAVLARVTEPFFTTKEPGKGTGLGLAMAKGFVEQSGGSLSIESVEGQGTTIYLCLPQAGFVASEGAPADDRIEPVALRPAVLLADDDPIVRKVLAAALEDAGYAVMSAGDGTEALALLQQSARIDILVSDLTMPGMDGLTLIRESQALRPGLPAVLLTGYAGDGAALAIGGAIAGTFSLLRKPIAGAQLVDRISGLLESSRMRQPH
jgi:PAS domain S-box-containing protein